MKRSNDDVVLESLLRDLPRCPSSSFTNDVMRRVSEAGRPGIPAMPFNAELVDPLPWWTRALLEPVTLLAFLTAALVAGWPTELLRWSSQVALPLAIELAARTSTLFHPSSAMGSWNVILLISIFASLLLSYFAYRGALSSPFFGHSIERAIRRR